MIAKALKNPALREKFHVGDIVRLPRQIWGNFTSKLSPISLIKLDHKVVEAGDRVIEHGKNRLCRFAIVLGEGTTALFNGQVIWEEWMLEKIENLSKPVTVETCAIEGDETSLPPHE
jgi:hypothetical protein